MRSGSADAHTLRVLSIATRHMSIGDIVGSGSHLYRLAWSLQDLGPTKYRGLHPVHNTSSSSAAVVCLGRPSAHVGVLEISCRLKAPAKGLVVDPKSVSNDLRWSETLIVVPTRDDLFNVWS